MFGVDGRLPVYFGHEVVNLCESEAETVVVLSDDSNEVISPLVPRLKTHVCKKLFDDEPVTMLFKTEISYPAPFPLRNAFPPKPDYKKGETSTAPSGESSCASCSPVKWFSFNGGNW